MNRFTQTLLICCAGLVVGAPALAQSLVNRPTLFGQMGPLDAVTGGGTQLGAYMAAGHDIGVIAEVRGGSGERSSMGLAVSKVQDTFGLQGDLRGGLATTSGSFPVTLGGQLAAGMTSGDGSTAGYGQVVPGVSFQSNTSGDRTFSSWAGMGYRLTAATHRSGSGDTVLRIGSRYNFTPGFGVGATLEDVGSVTTFIAGTSYSF